MHRILVSKRNYCSPIPMPVPTQTQPQFAPQSHQPPLPSLLHPVLPLQCPHHTLQHPPPHNRRHRVPNLFLRSYPRKNMLDRKPLQRRKLPDCKIPLPTRVNLAATVARYRFCNLVSPAREFVAKFAFVRLVIGGRGGDGGDGGVDGCPGCETCAGGGGRMGGFGKGRKGFAWAVRRMQRLANVWCVRG